MSIRSCVWGRMPPPAYAVPPSSVLLAPASGAGAPSPPARLPPPAGDNRARRNGCGAPRPFGGAPRSAPVGRSAVLIPRRSSVVGRPPSPRPAPFGARRVAPFRGSPPPGSPRGGLCVLVVCRSSGVSPRCGGRGCPLLGCAASGCAPRSCLGARPPPLVCVPLSGAASWVGGFSPAPPRPAAPSGGSGVPGARAGGLRPPLRGSPWVALLAPLLSLLGCPPGCPVHSPEIVNRPPLPDPGGCPWFASRRRALAAPHPPGAWVLPWWCLPGFSRGCQDARDFARVLRYSDGATIHAGARAAPFGGLLCGVSTARLEPPLGLIDLAGVSLFPPRCQDRSPATPAPLYLIPNRHPRLTQQKLCHFVAFTWGNYNHLGSPQVNAYASGSPPGSPRTK